MTTFLDYTAPAHHPGHRGTRETASTPIRKPAGALRPKSLLRALTGADGIKLPHHPHRRRPSRY